MLDANYLVWLVVFLALAFDYINGFHDTANAIATSVSTRAIEPKKAIMMTAALNFLGAMVSTGVAKTIGGDIVMSASLINSAIISAALGAALSIILVLLCVGKSNSPVKLILIGMGMTGIFSALTMMIIYGAKHEAQVRSAMFWLLGSFAGIQWGDLPLTAIIVTLFMLYIYMFNQDLDVLLLGNHEAAQMGLSVKQLQLSIVIISSIVIATLVSKVGVVGFIGLIIPHLARIVGGPKHRNTLLFSALIGSIVMIWSDVLSRALYSPEEIPIGVLTSLLGAPLFIWIIMNRYKHNG